MPSTGKTLRSRVAGFLRSPEAGYVFWLFIATRIALALIGVASNLALAPLHSAAPDFFIGQVYDVASYPLPLRIWGIWDTSWYLEIAEDWYPTVDAPQLALVETPYPFFPLYPLLMKVIGSALGDFYIAGLLISNLSLIAAAILLYKLVRLDYGEQTARNSAKYMFLFPTAFILSGCLSESLFVALAIACFYLARTRNWLGVGAVGFFLSLSRGVGFLIFLPMLYEYLREKGFKPGRIRADVLFLLLIPLGLLALAAYDNYMTGDPFAFFSAEAAWGRTISKPVSVLSGSVQLSVTVYRVFLAAYTLVFLGLLAAFYRKFQASHLLFALFCILVPLSTGLGSMPRYILVVFPFYILFAQLASGNKTVDKLLTISLALAQAVFMVLWSNGTRFIV